MSTRKQRIAELLTLLKDDDVEWVVNDIAELGVKIGNRFFFMYKGRSLEYSEDNEGPMFWRHVYKREFGECVHPWQFIKERTGEERVPENYPAIDGSSHGMWKNVPLVKSKL